MSLKVTPRHASCSTACMLLHTAAVSIATYEHAARLQYVTSVRWGLTGFGLGTVRVLDDDFPRGGALPRRWQVVPRYAEERKKGDAKTVGQEALCTGGCELLRIGPITHPKSHHTSPLTL